MQGHLVTFLFGNRLIGTGEGDEVDEDANIRLSGGFLEPMPVSEGEIAYFFSKSVFKL